MQTASRTYKKNGRRYRYRYRAVTYAGSIIHSKDFVTVRGAQRTVDRIKPTWPDAEVQRVREILVGDVSLDPDHEVVWARQYELMRNGRWVSESTAQTEHVND